MMDTPENHIFKVNNSKNTLFFINDQKFKKIDPKISNLLNNF